MRALLAAGISVTTAAASVAALLLAIRWYAIGARRGDEGVMARGDPWLGAACAGFCAVYATQGDWAVAAVAAACAAVAVALSAASWLSRRPR